MKRVKNLTGNKDLINTFKKFKNKNHLFKSTLKKKYFSLSKLQHQLTLNSRLFYFGGIFKKIFFKTAPNNLNQGDVISNTVQPLSVTKQSKNFILTSFKSFHFKKILMFINLYFY